MKMNRNHSTKSGSAQNGAPLIVFVSAAGSGILAYLIGQLTFLQQHPIHWLMAIIGSIVGWFIGKFIYRLRGEEDII